MRLMEIDIEEWAEFVTNHPQTTLFHTREWISTLREGFPSVDVKLYSIIDKKEDIIGVIPVEINRKMLFRLAGSPLPGLFTPYQGPLLLDSSEVSECELTGVILQTLKPQFFALDFSPSNSIALVDSNLSAGECRKTILVNLDAAVDQLWRRLKAKTRNEIRQAQQRGVEIYEPSSASEWLGDYWEMHKEVYLRQRMPPPGRLAFYEALWKYLYNKDQLKVVLARDQGKTIAGGIFGVFKDRLYFLDGASFHEYRILRGNNLIQWHIICWAATKGLRVYDMLGANIPSIAHFKRGFGGMEASYGYLKTTCGFRGRIGLRVYERYRPLFKRLGL